MIERKIKNFKKELAIINWVEGFNKQKVLIRDESNNAYLNKSNRKFIFFHKGIFPYSKNGTLDINIEGSQYYIKSSDFKEPVNKNFTQIPCESACDVDTFTKGNLNRRKLFRMFFFDKSERTHIFHHKLEFPKYDGKIPWAFECTRVQVKNKRYDIIQHKHNNQSYIIIENLDPVSYSNFKKDSYSIQKGIGFLIGYMPGGENYIFSGDNFVYQRLSRKALKSIYHPVTSNPYSFTLLHDQRKIAERYESILTVIPASVISNFVNKIHDSEELSVAIIFLMEVASLSSVVSMPGVFSVILESFANIIINEQKIRQSLITDEELAKEIIDELNLVIDKNASKMHSDAAIKIRRRVAAINQPVNTKKISNAMKLREPFDQLGISLSNLDEKAIDYRNDLLHGNILMHDETKRTSKEIDNRMIYVSAKLYTLISKLILKYCGYNGYVINHAKFYDLDGIFGEIDFFEKI
ncbi:hypothetical protein [Flavobacterium phycosphaerae]|uniref:hypothetical protein n=1 Tax=Flavobacterium phycosphaerae TaxID=2697515 RepID=UPI00138ABC5A|nr:hypothetical protein [Flavobacterium phycosphaerae]